jgi:hypothetical protein
MVKSQIYNYVLNIDCFAIVFNIKQLSVEMSTFTMCNMISSICRKHLPVLSSFMTYHRICNQIDTTGATSGAGTTYPSRAPEFTLILMGFVLLDL